MRLISSVIDGTTVINNRNNKIKVKIKKAIIDNSRFFIFILYWMNLTNGWEIYAKSHAIKKGNSAFFSTVIR